MAFYRQFIVVICSSLLAQPAYSQSPPSRSIPRASADADSVVAGAITIDRLAERVRMADDGNWGKFAQDVRPAAQRLAIAVTRHRTVSPPGSHFGPLWDFAIDSLRATVVSPSEFLLHGVALLSTMPESAGAVAFRFRKVHGSWSLIEHSSVTAYLQRLASTYSRDDEP